MAGFVKVAEVDQIPEGGRKSIVLDDRSVLLVRVAGNYYAFEDLCTHDGQPLTDGPLAGKEITCPRHGARFDVTTGRPLCMPATEPVETFAVEVRADGIYASGG